MFDTAMIVVQHVQDVGDIQLSEVCKAGTLLTLVIYVERAVASNYGARPPR